MKLIKLFMLLAIGGLTSLVSCKDDEAPKPFTINFTNTETGISATKPSVQVGITFSREAHVDGEIVIQVGTSNLIYGSASDFFTTPEVVDNVITIAFSKGEASVTFTLAAGEGLNIQQDESISFTLIGSEDFVVGEQASFTATFSENFIANSGTLEFNGGGEDYPNQSFADLSKLMTLTVEKHSWDLGFSTVAGTHQVIINSHAFMMARALDKNDLTLVTAEDTVGFIGEMVIPQFDPSIGSIDWVDQPDGDLTETAIGEISATDADNNVFIIKREGEGRNWKKVRILQNAEGYTIQHANIAATEFSTYELTKDEAFNFTFFDLDFNQVFVEPEKDEWDIMFSTYTEALNLGAPGMDIPYGFKDFVLINRFNTRVGMVMTTDVSYENFESADVANVTFSSKVNALGSSWRSGGGPTSGPALYEDRYYVIEDSEGTIYKLKFNRLTALSGERGYPEFSFALVD